MAMLGALCAVAAAAVSEERALATTPAFFISGFPLADTSMVTDYLPAQKLWASVESLAGKATRASISKIAAPEAPEVVVAVVMDDVAAANTYATSTKLQALGAPAFLAVPFVFHDGTLLPDAHRTTLESASKVIAEAGYATNGVRDLVIATADRAAANGDRLVQELVRSVDAATSGKYVVVITGNHSLASTSDLILHFGEKLQSPIRRKLATSGPMPSQIPLTPGILTGLLVGGLLFIIFINGFCCLFSLQTPKKFETE